MPTIAFVEAASNMGGVEFSTLYLAQRLDPSRYRPIVICPAEGDLTRQLRQYEIPLAILSQPRLLATSIRFASRYWPNPFAWVANLFLLAFMAWRLAACLKHHAVNLVCTKGLLAHFYGGAAARLGGIPCVWHVQDLVSNRAGGLYPLVLGTAGRLFTCYCIVDGTPIADQLRPYIRQDRLLMILNGVDVDTFSPAIDGKPVRQEWGVGPGDILIGSVARFTPWKGQQYLVEAFGTLAAEMPETKLVLVGAPVFDTADYERELRERVARLGLQGRVIFAGYRLDLPQVLAALDLFAHTSIDKDTSPLAVVSAMASGKAMICTNVKGVAELFPLGTEAVLVPVRDSAALATALRGLLRSPLRRAELGTAARQHAENVLSLQRFALACQEVFDRAMTA